MLMRAATTDQRCLHVARRKAATSNTAYPNRGGSESVSAAAEVALRSSAGPVRTFPDASPPASAGPIWFAVLMASSCLAKANGEQRAVRWDGVSGRALYTNLDGDAERIEPLGVSLMGGQTLAVYWMPGETAYTVEVYRQNERCA